MSSEPCSYFIGQPSSEVQSNLPDFILKYVNDTKRIYTAQSVLPESDWPPPLGGQYIRLALIKQGRTTQDFKYSSVVKTQIDYVRGYYDKILEFKTEISQEAVFDPIFCEGGTKIPLRMLIDGSPGVGKTTFSRFISSEWAKCKILQEYWLVLLLHLREKQISKATSIEEFFYHDDHELQKEVVKFVLKQSGKGVLLILDGFDELSLQERNVKSLLLDVIKGCILRECAVIVTSRPYASRPVQELQSVNRHIEVLGFTDEQVKKCIEQKVMNQDKAAKLCDDLKDRLDIVSLCQIPLNCSIVLFVYEQEDYQLPDTLTELYELFVLHTLKRYTKRTQNTLVADDLEYLNQLPMPLCEHLRTVSRIAFEGLKDDNLVFSRSNITQAFSSYAGSDQKLPVLDLMTCAKSYSSRGAQDTYSFLHLTIQEFLAAFWLAHHQSDAEKAEFFQRNFIDDRFRMVLLFLSGITKLYYISRISSIISPESCSGHMTLICHLLYESRLSLIHI